MRLQNKVAIVTGAGSGFGEGIAKRFAEEGASVVVNDVDTAKRERVAREIGASGGRARSCAGDVSSDADVAALVRFALDAYGDLDVVVNNAGTTHRNQPMLDVTEDEFDRIYRVNVKSLFLTARHAVPHFRRKQRRRVHHDRVDRGHSAAARAHLVQRQQGRRDRHVAVDGGRARAGQHPRQRHQSRSPARRACSREFMGADTPEIRAKFVATIPLGRLSQPTDIATAAVFFASDEAAFITGACLEVDGGRCV